MSDDVFEMEAPKEMVRGGGAFLEVEGTFHLKVLDIDTQPKKADGSAMFDAAMKVSFEALGGTVEGVNGRQFTETFWKPNLSDEPKKQDRTKAKIAWFLVAIGMREASDQGPLRFAPKAAIGRQLIARTKFRTDREGNVKTFNGNPQIEIAFNDMFHVDDPTKAGVPKNAEALAAYPKEFRRSPESFAKDDGRNAKTATTAKAPTAPVTPTSGQQAAASSVVTADDV